LSDLCKKMCRALDAARSAKRRRHTIGALRANLKGGKIEMKKVFHILTAMLFVFGSVVMCEATAISTSATGNLFGDNYGYSFVITNDSSDNTVFHATLENTSTSTLNPLIDELAFNIEAIMDTNFFLQNIEPNWTVAVPDGEGVQFQYVGSVGSTENKLQKNQALTFDFNFVDSFLLPSNPFDIWLDAKESYGKGLGGGEDFGQVAVSFQRLGGEDSDESDLLASNWEGGADPQYVIPEPATMLLLGSGFIGIAFSGKKKFKKRNG